MKLIPKIERLKLEPDDVVVVHVEGRLSEHYRHQLGRQLVEVFPNNKIALLDDGMRLTIVGPELQTDAAHIVSEDVP